MPDSSRQLCEIQGSNEIPGSLSSPIALRSANEGLIRNGPFLIQCTVGDFLDPAGMADLSAGHEIVPVEFSG